MTTTADAATASRKQLDDFATLVFQAIIASLDSRLPQPLQLVEASLEDETPAALAAHFAPTCARVDLRAGDLDGAPFTCLLDQRAAHLLAGSLVPVLDEDLCVMIQTGESSDELKGALQSLADVLKDALGGTLATMGLSSELSVEGSRFGNGLLCVEDDCPPRIRGLFEYRGVRLLLLVELPGAVLERLGAS
ncbi:MAG: hypothetical protein H6694_04230 [Candidatus Latescibacteria bacterium]|nr:hypothetical protein [Candidatus Latescibacterota bacterium]